jgi:hypothetical protein
MAPFRKKIALLAAGGALLFLAIQLVPYGRDHTNPPVIQEARWDSATTEELVEAAYYDCHSNETRRPWYSKVAPASWLLERDIRAGREELNFSEMNREDNEFEKAAETVVDGEMPPFRYTLMHKDARLSQSDHEALIRGLQQSLPAERED